MVAAAPAIPRPQGAAGMRLAPVLPLVGGVLCLLAGLAAGEARLGWQIPVSFVHLHGPLMVCGFFGTIIGLERAVALSRPWAFIAPLANAGGGLLLLTGWESAGALAMALGSLAFLAVSALIARRQPTAFTALLALAALAWAAANLAWVSGADIIQVVPAWAAFLVLTIAGERLELSRFLKPWRWRNPALLPPVAVLATGSAMALAGQAGAWSVFGIGCVALVAWCLGNDIVRRTVRQKGLPRYVAVSLLSGYGWLAVAGLVAPGLDGGFDSLRYDAVLHAIFVGFVFAMVFGHAPVVLPALLRVKLPFHTYFYLPLALLHASLILRMAGDLGGRDGLRPWEGLFDGLRPWGGLLNGAAIVAFALMVAATILAARKRQSPSPQ